MRIAFDQSGDVGQVFLAFAAALLRIKHGPDFALEHVFQAGDGQGYAQHVGLNGVGHKGPIALVDLNLHLQPGAGQGDVEALAEALDLEMLGESPFQIIE